MLSGVMDEAATNESDELRRLGAELHADVWGALRDPAVVHGMCEDYRAGLRIDREHEEADPAAGRRIACPMLLLVATEDDIDIYGDPEAIWRPWVAGSYAAHQSARGTTKPNRHPTRSRRHCSDSSAPTHQSIQRPSPMRKPGRLTELAGSCLHV